MAIISIQNLSKAYRLGVTDQRALFREWMGRLRGKPPELFWALRDISFDVQEGEVIGILGHNGAGKSTLLKNLAQITRPTHGRILLRGRVASLLEVGTGFHPELTGRENVFLNGAILGMRRREVASKFKEIVEFAQVDEFIDTPVKRYSTGMRVRLAFAVAAHLEPEILIIDEVLAVGDANFQQKCMGKMGEVATAGRTVLFVSHNTAAVQSLCTRCVVLDHGKLVFDGPQEDALKFYADRHSGSQQHDLRARQDRSGSGEVRAVGLEIRDRDGAPTRMARSGEGMQMWVHYESATGKPVPSLTCDLTITNVLGAPLITQSNNFTDQSFFNLPPKGTLVCQLDSLPLIEGAYRINLTLYPLYRRRAIMDEIQQAGELSIMQTDFFGKGKAPRASNGDGPMLVGGSWSFRDAVETTPAEAMVR